MTDRLPGNPGRHIAVVTTDQLQKMQKAEPFSITLTRDDTPIQEGTPYSKAAVLPDDVAQMLCAGIQDPTPADAFRCIGQGLYKNICIEFQLGSIAGADGNEINIIQRCRSGYLSVCGDEICCLSDANYDIFGHFYGADGTYLGNTGWLKSFVLADYMKANPGIAQLRLVIRRKDEKTMTVGETAGICWLFYNKFDRACGKLESADLGSKDVFALPAFVIGENSYQGADGLFVDQEGCSVYRLYLGEHIDSNGNLVDYTYLFGKTVKIKTYAYGDMAYGFEGEAGALINPDADIATKPESGVCEFEVTLPEVVDVFSANPFFHVSFCENPYTDFAIYEKKGTAWEEIKALWMDSYAKNSEVKLQLIWNEINKINENDSAMDDAFIALTNRVATLEENTPAVYDGSVTVE